MTYKPRMLLEDAIKELIASSRECPVCHRHFVYGREGSEFCSRNCASAMAQRNYRKRTRSSMVRASGS